ncbi:putative DNA helicase ino80 [Agyrium rufum]|nr:putative DNA helicase ino80 [Agyrium rufum]
MYRSPVLQRSPIDEDGRQRRDFHANSTNGSNNGTAHQHPQQQQAGPPAPAPPPPLNPYDTRSPNVIHRQSFSPPSATHSTPAHYDYAYSNRPSTSGAMNTLPAINQSPRLGPPLPSPTSNGFGSRGPGYGARDQSASSFYDPTQEHRDNGSSWTQASRTIQSPSQTHSSTFYLDGNSGPKMPRSNHHPSPTKPVFPNLVSHSHPTNRQSSFPPSPTAYSHTVSPTQRPSNNTYSPNTNGFPIASSTSSEARPSSSSRDHFSSSHEENRMTRRADPMSFSSILSSTTSEPTRPVEKEREKEVERPRELQPAMEKERDREIVADPIRQEDERRPEQIEPPPSEPPIKSFRRTSRATNGDASMSSVCASPAPPRPKSKTPTPTPSREVATSSAKAHATPASTPSIKLDSDASRQAKETKAAISKSTSVFKVPPKAKTKNNVDLVEQALKEIDAQPLSDVENDEAAFEYAKKVYRKRGEKRVRELENQEDLKRKRRRIATSRKFLHTFDTYSEAGKESFRRVHEPEALAHVQQQEVLDEKERKKDMQRKRRRERTVAQETQKRQEAIDKAQVAQDKVEKEKFLKEAQRAERKAKSTKRILEVGETIDDIGEVTPLSLNLEGGTTSEFQIAPNASPEPPKKKAARGSGTRLKKSKEKKQAEKDAAEAAFKAQAQDDQSLPTLAPKAEGSRKDALIKETKEPKSKEPSPAPLSTNFAGKGYNQMYESIFRDIGKKEILKVWRVRDSSKSNKQSNKYKTAQLSSKESRRWEIRTNKSTKDTQGKYKRGLKEMMTFWKRNEREERDLRRVAEKQELDNMKKAEADREANRQKRKLNFLISQTELYSHFIGRKIKTDEVERSTDNLDGIAAPAGTGTASKSHMKGLPDSFDVRGVKVTNFEDLDFDAEDESVLQRAAMANAQNAIQEAQDKARAFNKVSDEEGQVMAQFDEGDMNFQNPTGMGEITIQQPKMLTVPLKEYQLKGLNWLANLYDQGINGILADEMGLGKTVQSISVMGYLAEQHDIWGPFLVIAPASTLHNWEQEIRRFVPQLKVLPYWGTAKDRKTLRKQWDRKHIIYKKDHPFHITVTSYQLVVHDASYFAKMRWQYMILDEAQAIKSSQSSRWKSLLGFHCRNRLLLTGTPIQNNMQELWALLHFIMPSLFDSHDEFSDWFSKDIESHAQSNTKLNEDQLKRLHMILKPFMLRRLKSNVQKELGDKVEKDVFCDLTYRQRAYYSNLRNRISIMDLIEKATVTGGGDDQDAATLMNLVMQFRKVCNHPDLFERADTTSPLSLVHFAETASFLREGHFVDLKYSTRNLIEYDLPRLLCSFMDRNRPDAATDVVLKERVGTEYKGPTLSQKLNIWRPENIESCMQDDGAFSWLRFADVSVGEAYHASKEGVFERAVQLSTKPNRLPLFQVTYDHEDEYPRYTPAYTMLNIVDRYDTKQNALVNGTKNEVLQSLMNVTKSVIEEQRLSLMELCARPAATAPPIQIACDNQSAGVLTQHEIFNTFARKALYGVSPAEEFNLIEAKVPQQLYPVANLLPAPDSEVSRFTNITVPSMRRFVTDSGKLARLDELLRQLKQNNHRVLLYFQMTRMIDLMEEYLTYRGYKYLRLDGSTKLEDRRDTVHDFQTRPEIFIFLLSTRAGGLGINLTSADTVIFYDSDWNPTIDSQAMDRAHRLGQTKQVTVYRLITRGTIEERIRKRALQKEEVQRVVISGGAGGGVDFNTRSKENRTKDIAMWLADDDQAELIERKEKEVLAAEEEREKNGGPAAAGAEKGLSKKKAAAAAAAARRAAGVGGRKKDVSLDDMYHEGEGHFDDGTSAKPSGAATPIDGGEASSLAPVAGASTTVAAGAGAGGKGGAAAGKKRGAAGTGGLSKKAKTAKQRLAIADGAGDMGLGGGKGF